MKTYFYCSLEGFPTVSFESVDDTSTDIVFYTQNGRIVPVTDIASLHYLNRSWVADSARLNWMEGGNSNNIEKLTDLLDVKAYGLSQANYVLAVNDTGTSTIWVSIPSVDLSSILLRLAVLEQKLQINQPPTINRAPIITLVNLDFWTNLPWNKPQEQTRHSYL